MNHYREAMEHCAPPAELKERLRKRVLEQNAPACPRKILRPRSFAKRALVAALIAVSFTASVGAVVLAVQWDAIFAGRFGEEAAATTMAQQAFQKLDVKAACGDVNLTVREALGDDRTIYFILDYELPPSEDRKAVGAAWDSETQRVECPQIEYYATGDISWDALEQDRRDVWAEEDWTTYYGPHASAELMKHKFPGGASGSVESREYDMDTGTLTYLVRFTTQSQTKKLTDQPLTLLVSPPILTGEDGTAIALADHPALLTFQPTYSARTKSGQLAQNDVAFASITLSPLAILGEYQGSEYQSIPELLRETFLVYADGTKQPLLELTEGYGGGKSSYTKDGKQVVSLHYSTTFLNLLNADQVRAVCIGEFEIPLESTK